MSVRFSSIITELGRGAARCKNWQAMPLIIHGFVTRHVLSRCKYNGRMPSHPSRLAVRLRRCLSRLAAALLVAGVGAAGPAAAEIELPAGVTLPQGAIAAPGQIADGTAVELLAALEEPAPVGSAGVRA